MRIKITKGGIFGLTSKENPSGELAIGTELTVSKAPEGWAGRYIDLDADQPVNEDAEALKARIAELEAENAKLKAPADADTTVNTAAEALALFSTDGVHVNTAKAKAKAFLGDKVPDDATKDVIVAKLEELTKA